MKLFNNIEPLKEASSPKDIVGFESERKQVQARIVRLIQQGSHSIVAYLAPLGAGKSSVLDQVKKNIRKRYLWVKFEPWRFSNRNELWDGFVIQTVSIIEDRSEISVVDEVEGEELGKDKRKKVITEAALLFILSVILYFIVWQTLSSPNTSMELYLKSYLKNGFPVLVSSVLIVYIYKIIDQRREISPRALRRVFQLEEHLMSSLEKLEKPLVIVVEDIDRAGEDGLIFLETLNNFLGSLDRTIKPIVVVSPQTSLGFDRYTNEDALTKGLDRSLKIYEEKIHFNTNVPPDAVRKLIMELKPEAKWQETIIDVTSAIFYKHSSQISLRLLKHILRESSQLYELNPSMNPGIVISFVMSWYISLRVSESSDNFSLAIRTLESNTLSRRGGIWEFFYAIVKSINKDLDFGGVVSSKITFVEREDESAVILANDNGTLRCEIELPFIYKRLIL